MKKILFVAIQMLLINQINAQKSSSDWQKLILKGQVNKIIEVDERCPSVIVDGGAYNCRKDTTKYEFDTKGYLLNSSNSEDENIKKITQNGFQHIITYEDVEGVKKKKYEDVYNSKNQLIKQLMYSVNSNEEQISNQWEYFYDKKGVKTQQKATEWWNGKVTIVLSDFNTYGDVIKRQTIKDDVVTDQEEFSYKYTNDKFGNWITKTSSSDPYNETWVRKIIYYKK
ncbi:hypothetical protein GKZ90_0020495 [Flavobacterium sp. MC2016-06]|jgi:hypothetical protein|uniref:hypothetical protein n=1 Tax=Flavobacterium sp. MC2016-06 TaxID=2676308 RepID=UPI0012BAFEAD|nr:hypothetical protein [Flavobacterium sp. MC2016-06]MBU3860851.1 hypothetical protein [Flavobacterium sp. MC2016-06]